MFHYTNDIGLRGILQSGNLWLTDMFSLNDPSELHHGYSAAARILAEKSKAKGEDFEKAFASQFGNDLKRKLQDSGQFFCCSFSAVGDDLGQWRAYGDDGNGFAIGFDCAGLQGKFINEPSPAAFPMIYDETALINAQEKIVERFRHHAFSNNALSSLPSPEALGAYWKCLHKRLPLPVLRVALHFKHPAYLNEREYRFLRSKNSRDLGGIKFRARNYQRIKYLEFDWKSAGTDVLKQIVIGPAADFEKSKRFAEDCLREAGIDPANVTVTQSQIPYKPT